MALAVGERAPDPSLAIRPRQWIRLSQYYGEKPVVLLFFPMAFSSTCTEELCAVADDWPAWDALDAHVFGISVDSPYVNVRFAEETKVPFPILSDFNREAAHAFDVVRRDLGGLRDVTERVVFVVDRNGVIDYVWQGEHPGVVPPLEEVKAAVRSTA